MDCFALIGEIQGVSQTPTFVSSNESNISCVETFKTSGQC
jgi:hypothetical protein